MFHSGGRERISGSSWLVPITIPYQSASDWFWSSSTQNALFKVVHVSTNFGYDLDKEGTRTCSTSLHVRRVKKCNPAGGYKMSRSVDLEVYKDATYRARGSLHATGGSTRN